MFFFFTDKGKHVMARRTLPMIEVEEILYRWCKKMGRKKIAETLGISVNTVKAITNVALGLGLERDNCTSERLANISSQLIAKRFEKRSNPTSTQSRIKAHHAAIEKWLEEKDMTIRNNSFLFIKYVTNFTAFYNNRL